MTLEAQRSDSGVAPLAIPAHVAIIMDGNGRWAERQGMPRLAGHRAGAENLRSIIGALHGWGVRYVTLYAFSTENWGRPNSEVTGLLELLGTVIDEEAAALNERRVRIRRLGALDRFPATLADSIRGAVELTKHNTGLTLCVALDYGGRTELVDAVRRIVASGIPPEDVSEDTIRAYLYMPDVPDPDLIIRTAGEQRLSNFLLWQAAYSEFYQTSVLWPDFDDIEVRRAIEEYGRRKRRFGKLPDDAVER